jgi:hypothetical protein
MILGMSTSAFTALHVVLSLVGILAGFVVVANMFSSKTVNGWTAIFLAATVLTSVTGFLFPVDKVLPSHIVGVSLVFWHSNRGSMAITLRDRGADSRCRSNCHLNALSWWRKPS